MAPSEGFAAPTPHGPITRICDGVHLVRGTFRMGPGLLISRTMTIVGVPDGLAIVNSVRLDAPSEAQLVAMGKVAHVIKLSDAHGLDDPYYVKALGGALWCLEGATPQGVRADRVLGRECPIPGGRVLTIPGTRHPEAALWIPHGGGTLITCDVVQHHVDTEGASFFARVMTPILGFKGGVIVPRMWRSTHGLKGEPLVKALAEVKDLSFANLVTGHGPAVIGGADVKVREAIAAVTGQG